MSDKVYQVTYIMVDANGTQTSSDQVNEVIAASESSARIKFRIKIGKGCKILRVREIGAQG
jgi:hypothetical protein